MYVLLVAPQVDFDFDLIQHLATITENSSDEKSAPIQVKENDKPKVQPKAKKKTARKTTTDNSRFLPLQRLQGRVLHPANTHRAQGCADGTRGY